jgi:predicted DNA-binding transcriptional regulator AlpA
MAQNLSTDSAGNQTGFQLLNESQAAKILCVSRACLRHWRAHDGGPPWVRVGLKLVRYNVDALRAWIERQAGVQNGQ